MENNIQNQCVPYNCLNNPEVEILNEERSTGRLPLDISLSLTRFLLSEFVPGVGVAFGLFDLIWGFITPSDWSLFLLQIEQLIEQRIETLERNRAITTLRGLADSYEIYIEALREWEANPNNAQLREDVRIRFANTDDALITAINNFTLTSFEIPLLSVYVQAANLHLSLLRDAVSFGQGWGLDIATVNNHYNRLINLIHRYTKHCLDTYNQGLENLRGTNTRQWARFNQFRRDLTLTVLDIVALFPNYDVRTYPIQTSSQLTREIYTSSVIEDSPVSANIPNGFNRAEFGVRPPHLMDFMNSLFVTAETVRSQTVWGGHLVSSRNTAGNRINFPSYGVFNPGGAIWIADEDPRPFYRTLSDPVFVRGGFGNPHYVLGLRGVAFQQTGTNHTRTFRNSGTIDSLDEIPPQDNSGAPWNDYSHVLNHVTFVRWPGEISGSDSWRAPMFSWTHRSATPTNTIDPERITQIPLVKAHTLQSGTTVVRGPGFTGGDILRRTSGGPFAYTIVNINGQLPQRYRARIRYASTTNLRIYVTVAGERIFAGQFNKTMDTGDPLTFQSFSYATINTAFTFPMSQSSFTVGADTFSSGNEVYIDRFELIPVTATFEAEYDLERAQKAVNALFTSINQIGIKTDVTDYHIDQVSNLVDCLSDEFCLDEKRELSEKVKHAKRLSDERNLLQDPNFKGINRQLDRGWRGSTDITIQRGDDVFKENYVTLPGTFDECYPTYLYQKIDESKLKPYTRYQLRGYIEDSQDLEIYLIRYNAKHETVNVLGTGSLWPLSVQSPIRKCGEPNRCAPHLEWNPDLDCSCRDGEKCAHHSHHFSLDIDVGCTDLNEDLDVWVIFKIKTQDGHARLGNLEFLEEKPLVGEALARVKRAEKKWRDKREKLELETNIVYKEAKESVDALFVNSQYDQLQADTNIAMIHAADKRVHRIREAYLPELSVIPGVNVDIFEELKGRIFTAFFLYDARNVIKNGDFNNGLSCWNVKG
ncbi:insecticidal delta-endotoxin Cry8Ea1 family protein, partial [Bacillus cereus]|nr:insecticidal delta-endotoxin Cry8Ea1 family protein [Bacillus cereus]